MTIITMNHQEVLTIIDNLVFTQTGKHLDTLQLGILKSVFNSQKYSKIAEEYHCTEGHTRDKAYELWHILSEALGEELHKSNLQSAIERLMITNNSNNLNNNLVNSVQIDSINLCPKSPQTSENVETNQPDISEPETFLTPEQLKQQAKLETVPKLAEMGLTAEQIAKCLNLPLELILDQLK